MNKIIQMVTFDLDGTIIDDEWAHEQAKVEIARSLGVTDVLELSKFTGRSNRLFWETVCQNAGIRGDIEELTRRQFQRVMELVLQTCQPPSTGLLETLSWLKGHGYTVALTSGSDVFFVYGALTLLKRSGRTSSVYLNLYIHPRSSELC